MSEFRIRRGYLEDADVLAQFNCEMAMETENKALDPVTVGSGVRRLLANEQLGFYLIAETDGNIAGCLAITTEWSDWRDGSFWWIQSVYVLPSFRRLGVFGALYEYVERLARQTEDVIGLRLYVEKENERAQQTYRHLGMIETGYRLYEAEFD